MNGKSIGIANESVTKAVQIETEAAPPANNLSATNLGYNKTGKTTKKVTPNRIIVPVFIYFKTLIFSFFDSCSAIKLVTPVDIPKSVNEVSIITKFTAAEKIPKSETDSDLATRSV